MQGWVACLISRRGACYAVPCRAVDGRCGGCDPWRVGTGAGLARKRSYCCSLAAPTPHPYPALPPCSNRPSYEFGAFQELHERRITFMEGSAVSGQVGWLGAVVLSSFRTASFA